MGVFRRSLAPVVQGAREVKASLDRRYDKPANPDDLTARAAVPLQPGLAPLPPQQPYEVFAREGYTQNDIVYACITALGTSAAEPIMAAWRGHRNDETAVKSHEVLNLLQRPNRFLSGYQFIFTLVMYRAIAGNVFIEKVRSKGGKLVELWPLRPDRVHILADPDKFIAGYRYQIGGHWWDIPPEDIIHLRTPNPLNDYYGMPPLMPAAGRIDIDNWSRAFIAAFFRNGGVPAGLLKIKRPLQEGERELIQARFRGDYGGPAGWHNLAIIDLEGADAEFQAAGMPLGERGLVMPELNFISEARIAGVFGVPLSLVGAVLGMRGSSYANRVSDRQSFWHETLSPLYRELGDGLTVGLAPEYDDIDRVGFDLSTVLALMPDADQLHARLREDLKTGAISQEEFRVGVGYDAEIDPKHTFFLPVNVTATDGQAILESELPPADTTPNGVNDAQQAAQENGARPNPRAGNQQAPGSRAGTRLNRSGRERGNVPQNVAAGMSKQLVMKDWLAEVERKSMTPDGMMICCYVDSPELPFDPAEGSLGTETIPQSDRHITLAYVPDPTSEQVKAAQECAQMVAHHLPVPASISGIGRFSSETEIKGDPFIALVDSPFLHDMRNELVQHLTRMGVPISTEHSFTPHVTLSYLSPEDPTPLPGGLGGPIPIVLDNISVKAGAAPAMRYTAGDLPASTKEPKKNGRISKKELVPATRF